MATSPLLALALGLAGLAGAGEVPPVELEACRGRAGSLDCGPIERGTKEPHCGGWGPDFLRDLSFVFWKVLDHSRYGVLRADPRSASCGPPSCVVVDLRYFDRPIAALGGSPAAAFPPGSRWNKGSGAIVAAVSDLFCIAKDGSQLACAMGHELAHLVLKHPSKEADRCAKAKMKAWLEAKPESFFEGRDLNSQEEIDRLIDLFKKERRSEVELCERRDEDAADAKGTELAHAAGFDPNACARLWPEFQDYMWAHGVRQNASHSPPKVRARNIQRKIDSILGPAPSP